MDDGSAEFVGRLLDGLRCGVYEARGRPDIFYWQGDERERHDERAEREERTLLAKLKAKYESPAARPSPAENATP